MPAVPPQSPQHTRPAPVKPSRRTPTSGTTPGAAPEPSFAAPVYRMDRSAGVDRLLATEWLLTNGLGGFAMGTCAGVPARRYHGLLVAASAPPGGRIMALNTMVESLVFGADDAERTDLATFRFCGQPSQPPVLHPSGWMRLRSFEQDLTCRWTYTVDDPGAGFEITKELQLLDGQNAVQLRYHVRRTNAAAKAARLHVRPLTSLRDFHGLIRKPWADRFAVFGSADGARVSFADGPVQLHLRAAGAQFTTDQQWWYDFFYQLEAERGQDCIEDLFSPGEFVLDIPADSREAHATIQASLAPMALADPSRDLARRRERLARMIASAIPRRDAGGTPNSADSRAIASLVTASDAFVVAPPASESRTGAATVIAGYPWFGDWGRDTSICIPGLMLATGRTDDARRCLLTFAGHRRNGIVPNLFNERSGEPEYNTVDASLWFILAACAYFRHARASGDRAAWDGQLAPACLDIVSHYRRGTDFNIAMDPIDKLITAGTNATQLTWMDAKRDGVTFTPRHGKAVEINALWHAALRELSDAIHDTDAAAGANLADLAAAAARSFRAAFWNAPASCLYDCLAPAEWGGSAGWAPIAEIRPNQLFAVSLPHSPLSPDQQRAVLRCVREKLLTPFGVRTLDPADPGARYRGRYEGSLFERDRAYHNGTAWPWLLGPYAEALLRVGEFAAAAKAEARAVLEPVLAAMSGSPGCGCIGQIAEIYDGDPPQRPQGCPAQAWSIAEALRVMLMIV